MTKALLVKIKELEQRAGRNWLQIIEGVASEEALMRVTNEHGVALTPEQAAEGFRLLKTEAETLTEEEIEGVTGGTKMNIY